MINKTELHRLFNYDPNGFLIWKVGTRKHKKAGKSPWYGKATILIKGIRYQCKDLIYEYHNHNIGEQYKIIDNGIKIGTKIEDLEVVENNMNNKDK